MLHKEGYRQLKIHCVVRWEKKEVGYEWGIHSPPWRKELSLTFLGGEQTSRCHLKVVKAIICPPALHHLLLLHRQSMTRTFQKKPGNFSRHCTQDLALRDISPFSHDLPAPTMTSAVATQLQPAGHKFYHSFMCYTWEKIFGQTLCPETGQCCERDQAFSWRCPPHLSVLRA